MDINAFWKDVLAQNEEALPAYFHPDATIRWHCSDEEFTVAEYVRANCTYPGEWDGVIERIEPLANGWVTAVAVWPEGRETRHHVVSFFTVDGEKITGLDEYWADDGDVPLWRQRLSLGRRIGG